MPYEYTEEEWQLFSKTQKKIVILIKKHGIEDKEKIRELIDFPLEPMEPETFRGHWHRLKKTVATIRKNRYNTTHEVEK